MARFNYRTLLLNIGAVLGGLCLLAAAATLVFGVKPLMFRSGSMEPSTRTGALALSVPVSPGEIHEGDVLSVVNSAGVRITHRVQTVQLSGPSAQLTLKGDANAVADPESYTVSDAAKADRVLFSVPVLGYAVSWLSSPAALFAGGLFTAFLLYVAFIRKSPAGDSAEGANPTDGDCADGKSGDGIGGGGRGAGRGATPHPPKVRMAAAAFVVAVTAVTATAAPTQAAFSDGGTASATLGTGTVPAPSQFSCSGSGRFTAASLAWTPPSGFSAGGFSFTYTKSGGPSVISPVTAGAKATSVILNDSFFGSAGPSSGTYAITIRTNLTSDPNSWYSDTTATQTKTVTVSYSWVFGYMYSC